MTPCDTYKKRPESYYATVRNVYLATKRLFETHSLRGIMSCSSNIPVSLVLPSLHIVPAKPAGQTHVKLSSSRKLGLQVALFPQGDELHGFWYGKNVNIYNINQLLNIPCHLSKDWCSKRCLFPLKGGHDQKSSSTTSVFQWSRRNKAGNKVVMYIDLVPRASQAERAWEQGLNFQHLPWWNNKPGRLRRLNFPVHLHRWARISIVHYQAGDWHWLTGIYRPWSNEPGTFPLAPRIVFWSSDLWELFLGWVQRIL